eukprot:TRINITY_DN36074_c0_g1_i1.p1 TRINITY_DN36074_c0_g1~~TRINITY_DN36074_c0_g1_i1.p1  ORF type:complete len:1316 (-),score=242.54 TRINITY_DN36074_c0_g1_i1:101-3652(-)
MMWSVLQGLLSTVARPLLLQFLIQRTNTAGHIEDGGRLAAIYIAALLVTVALEGISTTACRVYLTDRFGAGFVTSLAGLIYSKGLKMSPGVAENEKALLSNDVVKCQDQLKLLCMMPQAGTALLGGIGVLLYCIGAAALSGIALMVAVLIFGVRLAKISVFYETKSSAAADRRLATMTCAVEGMKAVKLSAWEPQFLEQLHNARSEEVGWHKIKRSLHQISVQAGRCAPVLCSASSVLTLALTGGGFEAGPVFAAVSIFQSLRLAMTMLPVGFSYFSSWAVSMRRIEAFLLLPDAPGPQLGSPSDVDKFVAEVDGDVVRKGKDGAGYTCKLGRLNLPKGGVTAIVGAVGSGKTTALLGLLGDLDIHGTCKLNALSIGYVPQKAFVASGTLRHNILMGRAFDQDRYLDAIRRAALSTDIAQLQGGDMAEVGERGVTLSGGQQQRVGIARALYGLPDLLLADDPLAAVDPRVGEHIASHCFFGADRTRRSVVMSTNQLHLLPKCDYVVVLANGAVAEHGKYADLTSKADSLLTAMMKDVVVAENVAADIDGLVPTSPSAPENAETKAEPAGATPGQGAAQKLVKAEKLAEGDISTNVWKEYVAGMGHLRFFCCCIACCLSYGCMGASDRWLAVWLEAASDTESMQYYASIYGLLVVSMGISLVATTQAFSIATARAGRTLHDDACSSLFHAPLHWFEATPSGRILSRFGSDLSMVDNTLSYFLENVAGFTSTLLVLVTVLCTVVPVVSVMVPFGFALYGLQLVAADRCNRVLKRHANAAMAPVLSSLVEATHTSGRPLLRGMGLSENSWNDFAASVDELCRFNFLSSSVIAWQTLASYAMCLVFGSATSIWVLWGPAAVPQARIGLALTYAFLLPYFLLYAAFTISVLKISGTALERLLESCALPQESNWNVANDKALVSWPDKGRVVFDDVELVYRPGLPAALKGVSFDIPGGSRVGVVGRTGAGKSSLVVLLFRLVDASKGRVLVDGVDVTTIGLQTLRRAMSVIPQEPLLLSGTIRGNLDPFNEQPEAELHLALKRAGLGELALDTPVGGSNGGSGGGGLSSGQCQLLTLARALLRKASVVVMDEPTSNVDSETDSAVQRAVREHLVGCTLLTIAHRLHTIIDSDLLLVMEAGRLGEFDSPAALLRNPESHLSQMLNCLGPGAAQALRQQVRGEPCAAVMAI